MIMNYKLTTGTACVPYRNVQIINSGKIKPTLPGRVSKNSLNRKYPHVNRCHVIFFRYDNDKSHIDILHKKKSV